MMPKHDLELFQLFSELSVNLSELDRIRRLGVWRAAVVVLALQAYVLVGVGLLVVAVLVRPDWPLEVIFLILISIEAGLVLTGLVCVALLTPHTSRLVGMDRGQVDLKTMMAMFRALFRDIGEALRFAWLRRREQ
jgi:hypothetical protein